MRDFDEIVATEGEEAAVSGDAERAFDFLLGSWTVRHRKLRDRLAGCDAWFEFPGTLEVDPLAGGFGNFDVNMLNDPAGCYEAHALRIFRPATEAWTIWWLDSRAPTGSLGPCVSGGFSGRKGSFFGEDVLRGAPIQVRTTYEDLGPEAAQWTQAFRFPADPEWEVNWVMDFMRARP